MAVNNNAHENCSDSHGHSYLEILAPILGKFPRWLDRHGDNRTNNAEHAADSECQWEVAHVAKFAAEDGTSNAADTIGEENPRVVLADELRAKSIGRQCWEE